MNPQEYCKRKVAESGSNFTVAFSLLDVKRRSALESLYAFCREVDDIADECSDSSLAQVKLAWWRNELTTVLDFPKHPILLSLKHTLNNFDLPLSDFNKIIDGVQQDLNPVLIEDWSHLDSYCDLVAGAVGRLASRIFGPSSSEVLSYATLLGQACQYTNILRDVGEDLTKNRTYIPQHLIKKYLVNKSLNMKVYSKEFFLMCEEFSCRAHSKYHEAFLSLPKREYQRQRPGIVMGIIYRSLLENIEKSNYQVLTRRIRLSPLQKFWAAWRASWGTIPKRATL